MLCRRAEGSSESWVSTLRTERRPHRAFQTDPTRLARCVGSAQCISPAGLVLPFLSFFVFLRSRRRNASAHQNISRFHPTKPRLPSKIPRPLPHAATLSASHSARQKAHYAETPARLATLPDNPEYPGPPFRLTERCGGCQSVRCARTRALCAHNFRSRGTLPYNERQGPGGDGRLTAWARRARLVFRGSVLESCARAAIPEAKERQLRRQGSAVCLCYLLWQG